MAKYFIQGSTMTNIADGIRNITGDNNTYTGNQIKTELNNTVEQIDTQYELLYDIADKFIDMEEIAYLDGSLTEFSNDEITSIGNSAFRDCTSLTSIDLPNVTSIGAYAFKDCTSLTSIILRSNTTCALSSGVFTNTPISSGTGYIYVPSTLVDSYKTATNWSTYASQIRAIEDYPDICG